MGYIQGYCSIDEAWSLQPNGSSGSSSSNNKAKRRGGKKGNAHAQRVPNDERPVAKCHLYELDADPASTYVKGPFARTQAPLAWTQDVPPRYETPVDVGVIGGDGPEVDSDPRDDYTPAIDEARIQAMIDARLSASERAVLKKAAGMEFAAYVISGLLLILILEQAVTIGCRMRPAF